MRVSMLVLAMFLASSARSATHVATHVESNVESKVESGGESTCSDPSAITLNVDNVEIRVALTELANATHMNIAIRTNVHGRVSANLTCVSPRTALEQLLLQLDATYCETPKSVMIRRIEEGSCEASWRRPIVQRTVRRARRDIP